MDSSLVPEITESLPAIYRCTFTEWTAVQERRLRRMSVGLRVEVDKEKVRLRLAEKLAVDLEKSAGSFHGTDEDLAALLRRHPWFIGNWNDLKQLEKGNHVALEGADLKGAFLYRANLVGANLQKADLRYALLEEADLKEADLRWAKFHYANLYGGDLQGANMRGSALYQAQLGSTNLRDAKDFVLDGNTVTGAEFSHRSRDPYSILRRTYSGPKFTLILLLTVAAFLPHFLEVALWKSIGQFQQKLSAYGDVRFHSVLIDLPGTNAPEHELSRIKWKKVRVWEIVSRYGAGYTPFLMSLLLILYNVGRFVVTMRMTELRYEEERSGGNTPYRKDYYDGGLLFKVVPVPNLWGLHRYFLRWCLWVAIGSATFRLVLGLWIPVWLPSR